MPEPPPREVTDYAVVTACIISRGVKMRPALPILLETTGATEAACKAAMREAHERGLIDKPDGWADPTAEGDRFARRIMAEYQAALRSLPRIPRTD